MNSTILYLCIFIYICISCGKVPPFVGFYTCDPFQLGACQFLYSEKVSSLSWITFSISFFYFIDFYGISSALSFTGCIILIFPCTGVVPRLVALTGPKKVMGDCTKSLWRPKKGQQQTSSWSVLPHWSQLRLFLSQKRWAFFQFIHYDKILFN